MSGALVAGDADGSNRRDYQAACPAGRRPLLVRTYGGQAVWREAGEAQRLLPLEAPIPSEGGGTIEPAAPAAQLLAFRLGSGRVLVSGDGGLFGAQMNESGAIGVNDGATGNQPFAAAALRWLLGLSSQPPSLCSQPQ